MPSFTLGSTFTSTPLTLAHTVDSGSLGKSSQGTGKKERPPSSKKAKSEGAAISCKARKCQHIAGHFPDKLEVTLVQESEGSIGLAMRLRICDWMWAMSALHKVRPLWWHKMAERTSSGLVSLSVPASLVFHVASWLHRWGKSWTTPRQLTSHKNCTPYWFGWDQYRNNKHVNLFAKMPQLENVPNMLTFSKTEQVRGGKDSVYKRGYYITQE